MTMIDNREGFGPNAVPRTTDLEYDDHVIQLDDNVIIGETLSPDCPQNEEGNEEGGFCYKVDKIGLMIPCAIRNGKNIHIGGASSLPSEKIKSDATWGGKGSYSRNRFYNFFGQTREGKN
jgi:hypothetical protein